MMMKNKTLTADEAQRRLVDILLRPYERRLAEIRGNLYHDEKGRFTHSPYSAKTLDKSGKRDIMKLKVNLFDKSDPIYYDTFSIEEENGFEDIFLHGSPQSVQRVVNGKPVNMNAAEFAAYLKEKTNYHGGDIRLASCSTGAGDNSFAMQLSKELGVKVKAPDDDVYFLPDEGILFVGSSYRNTGKWRIFQNGKEVTE